MRFFAGSEVSILTNQSSLQFVTRLCRLFLSRSLVLWAMHSTSMVAQMEPTMETQSRTHANQQLPAQIDPRSAMTVTLAACFHGQ